MQFAVYVERFDDSKTLAEVTQEDFEAANEGLANALFMEKVDFCSRMSKECVKRLLARDNSHLAYYCRSKETQNYVIEVINGRLNIPNLRARYPRVEPQPNAWVHIPATMSQLDPKEVIRKVLHSDAGIEADLDVKVIKTKGKGARTVTCIVEPDHLRQLIAWSVDTGKKELTFGWDSLPFRVKTPPVPPPMEEAPKQQPKNRAVQILVDSRESSAIGVPKTTETSQEVSKAAVVPNKEITNAQQTLPLLKPTPVVERAPEQTTARLSSDGAQQTPPLAKAPEELEAILEIPNSPISKPESEESSLTRPQTELASESNSGDSREPSAVGVSRATESGQEDSKVVVVPTKEITKAKARKRVPACAPSQPRARDRPQRTCKSIYRRSQKQQQKQTMISDYFCVRTPGPPGPARSILEYSPHR